MDAICGVDSLNRRFNIIYIMRTNVVLVKLCRLGMDKSPSKDSDDGSCSGIFTLDEVNRLKIIQDVVDRRLTTPMAAQLWVFPTASADAFVALP